MVRTGKGIAVQEYKKDYCVVDLETTSKYVLKAEIVEISALKVRDGVVVGEYNQLVNPECCIPEEASSVNKITDDMVKGEPTIKEVLYDFMNFIGDDVIVGYNNAAYDMNIIYDKYLRLKGKLFENDYIDLLHIARRTGLELSDYRLTTISEFYGLEVEGAHRALKDCYLTKECYEKIYEQYGNTPFISCSCNVRSNNDELSQTNAIRMLNGILEDIIEDEVVTEDEFNSLQEWMNEHLEFKGCFPFDRVYRVLEDVLEDGIITKEELEQVEKLFAAFVDPVNNEKCTSIEIEGAHICITGEFEYGSRTKVAELIEKYGGIIDKSVKKATNYLVVGSQGSKAWKTGNYGGKIQKAMEINDKGGDIKIVEETDFIGSLI